MTDTPGMSTITVGVPHQHNRDVPSRPKGHPLAPRSLRRLEMEWVCQIVAYPSLNSFRNVDTTDSSARSPGAPSPARDHSTSDQWTRTLEADTRTERAVRADEVRAGRGAV